MNFRTPTPATNDPRRLLNEWLRPGVVAFALVAWMGTAPAHASRDTDSVLALVQELDSESAAGDVTRRLKRLGVDALPSMFSILSTGSVDGSPPITLTPERGRALRAGILAQKTANLRSFLRVTVLPGSSEAARKTALSLYAEMGDAGDLKRCIALGAGEGPSVLGEESRECTAAILRSDPRGHTVLGADLAREVPALFPYIVEAVGDAASPAGLRFLGRVLVQASEHDEAVLRQIDRLALKTVPPFTEELRSAVRSALFREDDGVVRAAARTAGTLADIDAVEPLIDMLEGRSARVRSAAHGALKEISGQPFASSRARWEAWYAGEQDWWREESDGVIAELATGEPARVRAALGKVVQRRLFRSELTGAILPLLDAPEPELRRLACQSLGQLGATAAAPSLVDQLTDDDGSVVREAAAALKSLSGATLPPDPEQWRAFLDERGGRLARN